MPLFSFPSRRKSARSPSPTPTNVIDRSSVRSRKFQPLPFHLPVTTHQQTTTRNSFLLGGHYYPGKDKRRRHLRTTTAGRILLSSWPLLWRRVLGVVMLYLVVRYVLLPSSEILRQAILPANPNELMQYDPSLSRIRLEDERQWTNRLVLERERRADPQARNQILEQIAPYWYHRNDPHKASADSKKDILTPQTNTTNTAQETPPKLRTLQNMHEYSIQCPDNHNIQQTTLVIQATMDRIWILGETCRRWKDPIVVVVGLTEHTDIRTWLSRWNTKCPQAQFIPHVLDATSLEMYPVNQLRNIGLYAVNTSHVLLIDVDFVPSNGLAEQIRVVLKERMEQRRNNEQLPSPDRDAIVVPAFERVPPSPCHSESDCQQYLRQNSSFIPNTFAELKACYDKGDCRVFQINTNWEGHHSTRTEQWLQRKFYESTPPESVQKIRQIACFDSLRYEPYVVLPWCPLGQHQNNPKVPPFYDERFHGYGKNKIEFIQHLRILGYQFAVLPDGFIVHNPHSESKVKELWNNVTDSNLHATMDHLYPQFLHELMEKYHASLPNNIIEPCKK